MTVSTLTKALMIGALCISAVPTLAGGYTNDGTIPVTIEMPDVQGGDAPLYVSVQKKEQFMGMNGFGTIIKTPINGTNKVVVNVDVAGDYAVSIWHDLNNDGVFSMTEDYKVLDGYGSSGTYPADRRPTFDDVKINVPQSGASLSVDLKYPN